MAPDKKAPLLTDDVIRLVATRNSDTTIGARNRTLLRVGFMGAFRRAELARLPSTTSNVAPKVSPCTSGAAKSTKKAADPKFLSQPPTESSAQSKLSTTGAPSDASTMDRYSDQLTGTATSANAASPPPLSRSSSNELHSPRDSIGASSRDTHSVRDTSPKRSATTPLTSKSSARRIIRAPTASSATSAKRTYSGTPRLGDSISS